MNHYEARQAGRRARLKELANKASHEAHRRHERTINTARNLNGQPILIGHHSERKHRALLKRMDNDMRIACELSATADDLTRRAKAVGTGGVSSDDSAALQKLNRKIDERKEAHIRMKQMNAAWRAYDRAGRNAESAKCADKLAELTIDDRKFVVEFEPEPMRRAPFPGWQLTNNNAEIRRLKGRIEKLEAAQGREDAAPETAQILGESVRVERSDNRLRLFFNGKPSEEIRRELKRRGFKWARSVGAWQRQLTTNAEHAFGQLQAV